jgi:serine phosphatase RsbU (regulator of sigma subunit)/anti-sigma regulatory factor (Ser/Thr protein kinase)
MDNRAGMLMLIRKSWQGLFGRRNGTNSAPQIAGEENRSKAPDLKPVSRSQTLEFDIAPNDPLLAYLLSVSSMVEVDKLNLDSPTLRKLKSAGVKVVVPLISQGELIGLLNLGSRRSEQEYSADDRRLLNTLAAQAAPALRVAQLARQQQLEARERERLAHELRVARVIQQTLLPKEIPALPGWQMGAHWQPARAVSGDFYDFILFPDGCLGIIVGDVTDKGVPAALVMATTRSVMRTTAERLVSPGAVLEHANNALCPDMPPNMFVTCLYVLLNPATGHVQYANAGHNLPYQRTKDGVVELRARGMPLGLLPEMVYEEKEATFMPGDHVILYSDGLIEAHNTRGEMFGFPRLHDLVEKQSCASDLIPCLLNELSLFTGPGWEQEDDVTFVSLERLSSLAETTMWSIPGTDGVTIPGFDEEGMQILAGFTVPSQPGNERQAMEQVVRAVQRLKLSQDQLERLKTAVAEATMNAMEHGNNYQPDRSVELYVMASEESSPTRKLVVWIRDQGGSQLIPESQLPDLDAKLAGLQSPRGWGLFLIKNMVDEMRTISDESHHTIELILHLEESKE